MASEHSDRPKIRIELALVDDSGNSFSLPPGTYEVVPVGQVLYTYGTGETVLSRRVKLVDAGQPSTHTGAESCPIRPLHDPCHTCSSEDGRTTLEIFRDYQATLLALRRFVDRSDVPRYLSSENFANGYTQALIDIKEILDGKSRD